MDFVAIVKTFKLEITVIVIDVLKDILLRLKENHSLHLGKLE